tara:strand:+ start:626 stop:1150 length:525 start_codon:yes stop_codon:yes gene_type:complete
MDTPLTGKQIEDVLGKFTPMLYSKLAEYDTIEALLPNVYSWRVILLETKAYSGHWVCIVRLPEDKYYYFNSYGGSFKTDLNLIPRMVRKMLGESVNYLDILLKDKDVSWNKVKYQGKTSQVCGRYVMLFIDLVCNMKRPVSEFHSTLVNTKRDLKLKSFDEAIVRLTERVEPTY